VYLDDEFCTASRVEFDPDDGCRSFRHSSGDPFEDDWDDDTEEDDFSDWSEEDLSEDWSDEDDL